MSTGIPEPLEEKLQRLETELEVPFVPGELEGWASAVRDAFTSAAEAIRNRFENDHSGEFSEIETEDPELEGRVTELREQDRVLLDELHAWERKTENFLLKASRAEPDEGRLASEREEFVQHGLRFVIAVRRQEVAARTWLGEALERDRGPVD